MKKLKQRLLTIVMATFMVLGLAAPAMNAQAAVTPAASSCSAVAIDADSGQVIYAHDAQARYPVASVSKLMTIAVIESEIAKGKLHWSDKVKVTKEEARISQTPGLSNVPLQAGRNYTVRQLVEMSLVKSADGATITLSRAQGDSTAQFVQRMNRTAQAIGLHDYRFYNPVGLNNKDMGALKLANVSPDAENEMTAADVAKLARYLLDHYPQITKISSLTSITVDHKTYPNMNTMLPGGANAPKKIVIDGLKTGTSDRAGQCFVSSGRFQGHRIVTVVMHSNNRFAETKQLYSYLANHYRLSQLKPRETVAVTGSKQGQVNLVARQKRTVWLPVGQSLSFSVQTLNGHRLRSLAAPMTTRRAVAKIVYPQLTYLDKGPLTFKMYPQHVVYRHGLLGIWDHLTKF